MAKKGDWVLTHTIVLKPEQRAPQVPEDTRKVPLEMWVKGYLNEDAEIGGEAEVTTRTKRVVRGTLVEVNPRYTHDYGEFVPELLKVGDTVRDILFGGDR
jgi:hypothetical protein